MASIRLRSDLLPRLNTLLWGSIVLLVVILAVYVSSGRYFTSLVHRHQDDILREANARLSFALEVDSMRGEWQSFLPTFEMEGLRLLGEVHAPHPVEIGQISIGVDVFSSVRTLSLQLFALNASGVRLHLDVTEDGQLQIPGFPTTAGSSGNRLFNFIFNTEHLALEDVVLRLHEGDSSRDVHVEVDLQRDGDFRRFKMSLLSPSQRSWFRAIAEGVGEPLDFSDFISDFHLEFHLAEVEYYRDMGRLLGLDWQGGSVHSELWFSMDRGKLGAAVNFSGQDLRAAPLAAPERNFELEEVSATLHARSQGGLWEFVASDIHMGDVHSALQVDIMRGEFGLGRFSIGTAGLDMSEVVDYVLAESLLPEKLAGIVGQLAPRGYIPQANLEIADLNDAAGSWRIRGNFEALSVESWKGAPGVRNASGYLSIGREEGLVQLQSRDFSMIFPKLYRHSLDYTEFGVQLEWQVFPDRFELRSGPFHGVGEEGDVDGLFAMDIPFGESPSGLEMDLLVGLQDSHPRNRDKYLPYTLPETLLDWLGASIGDGHIEDGAFIYRGSLRKEAPDYRTTQSYFNVIGTELDYHPQWPALNDFEGLVIIDDADVDVYGNRARLRNSEVTDIRVRARQAPDKHLLLEVNAHMEGDASDGLAVINDSALRPLVGDIFSDWQLQGELSTELQLQMDLTDPARPPGVQLHTAWNAVSIDLGALRLQVDGVAGTLDYDDKTGFSAGEIHGFMWGEPVVASVSQGREGDGLAELDVSMRGRVDAVKLREWLDLDLLELASGDAEVNMHILVPSPDSGEVSRLTASSDLQGVALDLPEPWAKLPDSRRNLSIEMPLVGETRSAALNLEEEVFLNVQLGPEGYQAGSLGFDEILQPPPEGSFILGGRVARVDSEQWADFIISYLMAGEDDPLQRQAIWLAARGLHIDEFVFNGEPIRDVRADAQQTANGWQLEVKLPWMEGLAQISEDFSHFDIDLARLDIDGVEEDFLFALQEGGLGDFEMPRFDLDIEELWWLGGNLGKLSFSMEQQGSIYHFRDIAGTIRGFELGGGESGLELDWRRGDESSTHVRGRVTFGDFGDVLEAFNYERMVETRSGELALDLKWPGAPTEYELVTAEGSLGIHVGDGRFLKTSSATSGTLRVVAILNLADFVRRLSLDISYLFQSGVPFDSITGDVLFDSGQLEITSLDVLGRSSRFQFVGQADVPSQGLDGELVATLPVASNLPWVAALVSGLPAAAAVYVASKVFTKQMDRFSSAVYRIDGAWNDPQVNFQRIFDDTANQKEATTAELEVKTEPGPEVTKELPEG